MTVPLGRRTLLFGGLCLPGTAAMASARPTPPAPAPATPAAFDATATVFHVAPGPATSAPAGAGTAADPFRLGRGGEYALNRRLRPFMDAGRPLAVSFADGTYRDVRLQIIREGVDRDTISLRDRDAAPSPAASPPPRITYADTSRCNRDGQNCRVSPADFTIGRDRSAPLVLRAANPGGAVFDGAGLSGPPRIDSCALTISGAVFGAPGEACTASRSPPITDIRVEGLAFRNYRDGIHVTAAARVVIADCHLAAIGNHAPRRGDPMLFGTFAFRIDGDSREIVIRDCSATGVRNAAGPDPDQRDDPGLIHAVYLGFAHDVVFRGNRFGDCSGPLVKFGFYPTVRDGAPVCTYPAAARQRCTVFVFNRFTLSAPPSTPGHDADPVYAPQQCFIEENSMVDLPDGASAPAGGALFLDNRFDNRLPARADTPVAFLRQELPPAVPAPVLPGWLFAGNVIAGIPPADLVATRHRGTPMSAASVIRMPDAAARLGLPAQAAATATPLPPEQLGARLRAAIAALPGPHDPAADRSLLDAASSPPAGP